MARTSGDAALAASKLLLIFAMVASAHHPTLAQTDHAPPRDKPASPVPGGTAAVVMDLSAIDGVIGKSVKSAAGEDMGRIVDLLVTPAGLVRGAVIDFGGILGVGSRKVAVDWKALSFTDVAKGGIVVIALTRNQVRVSPEYKPGDAVVILEATKPEPTLANPATPAPEAPAPAATATPGQQPK